VPCPEECDRDGTVRECQARQLVQFVEKRHRVPNPAVITGDFNAEPGTTEYLEFTERGWVDTHLAAGNPECDPETGIGCTAGRDGPAGDLESTKPNVDSRIDYIFVVPPAPRGAKCAGIIGAATGIFAGEPNPFAETCGPIPVEVGHKARSAHCNQPDLHPRRCIGAASRPLAMSVRDYTPRRSEAEPR
jgi:hypothetical protein